jgi:precorrin isomerase
MRKSETRRMPGITTSLLQAREFIAEAQREMIATFGNSPAALCFLALTGRMRGGFIA